MEVILLERIERLGQMGDLVKVKDGYARNFLLPKNKALRATEANRARFETERAQLEARNLEHKKEAEAVQGKVDGSSFTIIRQAGEAGQLYGSVSTRDIAAEVSEGGVSVTRNQVILDTPIKVLGLHTVRVVLHPEVQAEVTINVARTEEEAERQARGEDVTVEQDETDQETLDAAEVFEDEERARQAADELQESDDDSEDDATDTSSNHGDAANEDGPDDDASASSQTSETEGEKPAGG